MFFRPLLIGVCVLLAGGPACAADWYTGEAAPPLRGALPPIDPAPVPHAFGAAIDAAASGSTLDSFHVAMIGTIAPFTNFDQSGMRLRLGGIVGQYGYTASTKGLGHIDGSQEQGSASLGYEWVSATSSLAGFIGAEVHNDRLTPVDPTNPVAGTAAGLRAEFDFYTRPTLVTMAAGQFAYSTVHNSYYGALRYGLRVFGGAYVGPEIMALGDDFYRQWRLGAHVSGFGFGGIEFGASGGYANDRVRGGGAYGVLESRVRI